MQAQFPAKVVARQAKDCTPFSTGGGGCGGRGLALRGALIGALILTAASAALLSNAMVVAQAKSPARANDRDSTGHVEDANVLTGDNSRHESTPMVADRIPTLHVTLDPLDGSGQPPVGRAGGGVAGACPPVTVKHTSYNMDCQTNCPLAVQAGFVETEIAAATFTVPADQFPIRLDLAEMIFATQNATVQTTTQWSIMVWDGPPNTGILVAEFSSDNKILPHLVLPPGSTGANVQVSVDPGDPDQIYINNQSGTNKFSIGYSIDDHHNEPTSACSCILGGTLPAVCCPPSPQSNAFPTGEFSGPATPDVNWIWARPCPGGSSWCYVTGWFNSEDIGVNRDWNIRATYTPISCVTTGACCMPNGTCSGDISEFLCNQQGGNYQGNGTNCGSINCPLPVGACCFGNGSCIGNATHQECTSNNGTFMGVDSVCGGSSFCRGACCVPSTQQCVNNSTLNNCNAASGTFQGMNTTCATAPPCFGACCLSDGSCVAGQTAGQCAALNGTFVGNTACASANCPPPLGACCLGTSCLTEVSQDDCTSGFGGVWQGSGTDCEFPNPCDPVGACCLGSSCLSDVTESECTSGFGGVWQGAATTCKPSNPCKAPNCPADIAPPGGNGSVNVDDLLLIINSWGACAGCAADVAPQPNGNGIVNVDDLLFVINNWGDC